MSVTPIDHHNFATTFSVDQIPKEVFHAINNVRGWWSEDINGSAEELGNEFTYRYKNAHYCMLRVTEFIAWKRIAWLVLDNFFDFTKNKSEWKGTEIQFDIARKRDKTEIRFTHLGLIPDYECFDICSNSWDFYLNTSLRGLIRTGQGLPNQKEQGASV